MENDINLYAKEHLAVHNYAHRTRDIYITALNEFSNFLGTKKITVKTVQSFREYIIGKKLSAKTKNLYFTAVRSFLKFLADKRDPDLHPLMSILTTVKDRAGNNGALDLPTEKEISAFLETLNKDTMLPSPYYVLAILLLSTGLRLSEVLSLQIDSVGAKVVVIGKGSKQRVVFPDANSIALVEKYKTGLREGSNKKLFPLAPRTVQQVFNTASGGRITPHTLRHVYATRMIENGAPINGVQRLLGHSSLSTTQRYLHVSDDFLAEVAMKFNTRAT